jgi:trehalose 6-phosphate synthase
MDRARKLDNLKPTVISNRLPVKVAEEDGQMKLTSGTGGLITALEPLLQNNHGTWIGWPGAPVSDDLIDLLAEKSDNLGYNLKMVDLTEEEVQGYYRGFSNETIWPLFHDLLDHCNFEMNYWEKYQLVNYKFAKAIVDHSPEENFIWVQDYHLILVGHFLHEMGIDETAFFLHIPFPPKDIFIKLPWRREILEAMLEYRLIGFQTERDRRNFIRCLRHLIPEATISHHRKYPFIKYNGHTCRIGAFPISIDFRHFFNFAKSPDVAEAAWLFHEKFPRQKIMLGVDRLDYTKGIPQRLMAFENCLTRYPELRKQITLVQLVVPSRTEVPEYQILKKQIDEMVGRINGQFTEHGWIPIHYIYGTLNHADLFGVYRASEIALITPLKDGMNLVAKEYCASCVEDKGVLILSEFAGAAEEMGVGAILVNPYNVEEVADAIFTAHYMEIEEQQYRLQRMRSVISKYHIFKWVDQFVNSFNYNLSSTEKGHRKKAESSPAKII